MKPPSFEYFDPASLDDALGLLDQYREDAKVLAGGQSFMPLMNMRLVHPKAVIDINRIPELAYISTSGGRLAIGAMTRQSTIEHSPLVRELNPLLAAAMPYIGHFQIRNRGTIGGSIVHADPAAELPAVAVTLEAEMVLKSRAGELVVKADDLFVSYLTTDIRPDELLTEVRVPVWSQGWGWGFEEVCRRAGDFALVGAAAVMRLGEGGECQEARITLFGVAGTPIRMRPAESALLGRRVGRKALREVGIAVSQELEPQSDLHASAEYRKEVAGVLAQRALAAASARARGVRAA